MGSGFSRGTAAGLTLGLHLLCLPLKATAADAATSPEPAFLLARSLAIPVEGVSAADLRDTYAEARAGRRHEAIDIAAPTGTKVFAVDDGKLVKLFKSLPGGLTVYQFDPQGRLASPLRSRLGADSSDLSDRRQREVVGDRDAREDRSGGDSILVGRARA